MNHPDFETLLEYTENTLAPDKRAQIEAHLAGSCADCRAVLSHLTLTLNLLNQTHLATPPKPVLQQAITAFRASLKPRLRIPALLVFDNFRQASFAAVRGAARVRQLLYMAEEVDIDVQITPSEGHTTLVGQVLGNDLGGTQSLAKVRLEGQTETFGYSTTNNFGLFSFHQVPAGSYNLTVELGTKEITIEGLELT